MNGRRCIKSKGKYLNVTNKMSTQPVDFDKLCNM